MMQSPGLQPKDCPNYYVCGAVFEYDADELIELVRVREQREETIRITRTQAAIMMLMSRGNPQSLEDFNIPDLISEIEELLESVKEQLNQFQNVYVVPESVEAHEYSVKRPSGPYFYNKLTAKEQLFEPAERSQKVKVIHLSHSDDPRNIEGRLGIERRNRLTQTRTRLREIKERLSEIEEFLDGV
ncbi:hypothetical protein [Trichocoleus sp. DQ-A3]